MGGLCRLAYGGVMSDEASNNDPRQTRIDTLEGLLLAGSRIESIAASAAAVNSHEEMVALLQVELGIGAVAARVIASASLERFTAGFAVQRLKEELADLRRLQ